MKDKQKLLFMLRAFRKGDVSIDYAVGFILKVYFDSKRFNPHSVILGTSAGMFIGLVIYHIVST